MAKALSDLYTHLRISLGDDPSGLQPSYSDEQCKNILQAAVEMGLAPECITLSVDRQSIDPDPPNNDTLGLFIIKAALFVQGSDTPVDIRTRPMSVSVNNVARRDTLYALERMAYELENNGKICGASGNRTVIVDVDCHTYLCSELRDCPLINS